MSIHAQLTSVAQARLAVQRRNSTILSVIISVLVIAFICLLLGIFLLPTLVKENPTIVTYQANEIQVDTPEPTKVKSSIQRKPTSPASTMTRVIASSASSAVSIPVPDIAVETPSVEFGDREDFGGGYGDGLDFGDGGGGASFFNQTVSAKRIAYVIDYSLSMLGKRDELMRAELTKSVGGLKSGISYQMIYFSGPAWVAGSEMPGFDYKTGTATVKGKSGKKYLWTGIGLSDWTPKGERQPVDWIDVNPSNLQSSLNIIKDTPLSGGTDWENPLQMAFDMNPAPQIVFFMTDGIVSGRDMTALTNDLAKVAKDKGIIVNTVAMMEPKAEVYMKSLADQTGGQFTIIGADGNPVSK